MSIGRSWDPPRRNSFPHQFPGPKTGLKTDSSSSANAAKPLFVGLYKGIIIPGFLRWCSAGFRPSTVARQGVKKPDAACGCSDQSPTGPSLQIKRVPAQVALKTRLPSSLTA